MNPVLVRLQAERARAVEFIDTLLARVESESRDLVDAERSNLEATRQRIAELDAQIEPLAAFEDLRGVHHESSARVLAPVGPAPAADNGRSLGGGAAAEYRTAGGVIVDILRSRGFFPDRTANASSGPRFLPPDAEAASRLARAVVNQTTADTPGLLPTPIVGQVVNLIDASRPFITSLGGAKPMGGIPGKSFERPKITQHTQSGIQAAEKTALPSRAMKIDPITFTKATHGGTVDVSRQDIDWTSPSAWDILVRDLADVYAVDTEQDAANGLVAAVVTNTVAVATDDLAGWAAALYTAAGLVYKGGGRLPDRVWCSIDMWGMLGALVDTARLGFPPAGFAAGQLGESDLTQFGGYVLQLPRIVVPSFPDGTCIVGSSPLFEVYEETIGLLSVVEPSILGVEVAYGGYLAWGALEEKGFAKITGPAAP
jgi:HK97 family phage major capsid protein